MPKGTIAKATPGENDVILNLAADQIDIDPAVNVRSKAEAADEAIRIDSLAKAIYEQGQLQPVVVRPNGEGRYKLIAGHRRLKAIEIIRENTREIRPVKAIVVEKSDDEAWDAAFSENYQRRNFSPIELAENILALREKRGWKADEWARKTADYLGVSRATVTQHVKLLSLPADIREKVHTGYLSAQSAFELLAADEAARESGGAPTAQKVLERAEEKARAEEARRPDRGRPPAVERSAERAAAADGTRRRGRPPKANAEPEKKPEKQPKLSHKHVVAAVREAEIPVTKPRSRSEIVGWFEDLQGPALPDAMAKFVAAFVEKWAKGAMSDRALMTRWDLMAEMIDETAGRRAQSAKRARA